MNSTRLAVAFSLCLVALATTLAAQPAPAAPKNILYEGSFAEAGIGVPGGWTEGGYAGGDHGNYVQSTPDRDGNYVSLFIKSLEKGMFSLNLREPMPINPAWRTLVCSYDVRVFNFTQGPEGHHKPRMVLTFLDAQGGELGTTGITLSGKLTDAWQTAERRVSVPAGANSATIWIGTFSGQGQIDFRNLYVAPLE